MKILIYENFLFEDIQRVSSEKAKAANMFGPIYHGTTPENMNNIIDNGFQISTNKRNGYLFQDYYANIPPPEDHLGYGIYFTTSPTIAKKYNTGKSPKQKFFLNSTNIKEINYGSPKTMMKWWEENGYDINLAKIALKERNFEKWKNATQKLTDTLKSKYDAVYYLGKSMYSLLDGNQICVYDPKLIYMLDDSGAKPYEIGSWFKTKDGIKGKIIDKRKINSAHLEWLKLNRPEDYKATDGYYYEVKLQKGGKQLNFKKSDIIPI